MFLFHSFLLPSMLILFIFTNNFHKIEFTKLHSRYFLPNIHARTYKIPFLSIVSTQQRKTLCFDAKVKWKKIHYEMKTLILNKYVNTKRKPNNCIACDGLFNCHVFTIVISFHFKNPREALSASITFVCHMHAFTHFE
jgi:hypothetical protein